MAQQLKEKELRYMELLKSVTKKMGERRVRKVVKPA